MIETTMNASPRFDLDSLDFNDAIEIPSMNYLCEFSGSSLPHQSHDFLGHVSLVDMVGVKDDAGILCVDDVYRVPGNFNLELDQDTMGNLQLDSKQNDSFYSSLGGCGLSCWAENSNMGHTNMEVVLLPDYLIYQDKYYIGLKLTFSTSHIQISENNGAVNIKLAVGDLVDIKSQLLPNNETVMMELCVFDSYTLGIEKLRIVVVDSYWSLTLNKIRSLNSKYSAVWKIATEVDVEDNKYFSSGPTSYFPNFEVPFDEVVYPKGDPDAVSLSKRDVDLLQPDTYINDTVIDFYIQYLKNKIPKEEKSRFHFFNSFFFRKLADIDKDPSSACDGKAAFLRVRKWTRKVNIFEKDYIFIPVNFNLHWSLIVICHPGEVVNFNDKELNKSPRVPCILHMDSVKGFHGGLKNLVQSYLNEEWIERQKNTCGEDMSSRFSNMLFLPVAVPQQQNSYDCGLFLLHYLELFLAEAPYNFNPLKLSKFSNFLNLDWFQPAEAYLKRMLIQRLIFELVVNNEGFSSDYSGDCCCSENNDNWTGNHCPAVNGESSTSHSSKGIEMTVLPVSSSPVLKEIFEPGGSLGHSQLFDQCSSGHYCSGSMFLMKEETDLGEHLTHITTDPNFQQVSGISPPPQSCSSPFLSSVFGKEIYHRPITSLEADHVRAESSRGVSSCAPDDSDDDIEIIENFSLQNEDRSLHEEERGQENSASKEFKLDLWNIQDINDSPAVNIPVDSFIEIPPHSNSKYGENNLSSQETPTIPFHQVSNAVDDNIRYDNLQIIDNMEFETCEEQPTKKRRDNLQIIDNMESESCEEQSTKKRRLFDFARWNCDRDLMMGPSREKPKIWKVYKRRNKSGPNREKPKIWKVYKRRNKSGPKREKPKIWKVYKRRNKSGGNAD